MISDMVGGIEIEGNSDGLNSNNPVDCPNTEVSPPESSGCVPDSKAESASLKKVSSTTETSSIIKGGKNGPEDRSTGLSTPPPKSLQHQYQQHYLYQHVDPHQQAAAYYSYQQTPISPESHSPSTSSGRYDPVAAFLQQQAAASGNAFGANTLYGSGLPQLPLSPHPSPRTGSNNGVIPSASSLYPIGYGPLDPVESSAMTQNYHNANRNVPNATSPPVSYLQTQSTTGTTNTQTGFAVYQGGYANTGYGDLKMSPSSSPQPWSDRMNPQLYQQSNQIQVQGLQGYSGGGNTHVMGRGNQPRCSTQQLDGVLPSTSSSSLNSDQDPSQGAYFPTQAGAAASGTINAASNPGAIYAQQQWQYPQSPHMDGYSSAQQHHQQALNVHMQGPSYAGNSVMALSGGVQQNNHQRHGGQMQPHVVGKYQTRSSYYHSSTTPGPPIQTTACNKGPDGANLFIFHIPNHFTNLDMYHLFCNYGTLLSVRIMVEKDTGRSRGFGFVSYDSPDSAAIAIKELNGFVIGNKRLKVQHKQIRASNSTPQHQHQSSSFNLNNSQASETSPVIALSGQSPLMANLFSNQESSLVVSVSPKQLTEEEIGSSSIEKNDEQINAIFDISPEVKVNGIPQEEVHGAEVNMLKSGAVVGSSLIGSGGMRKEAECASSLQLTKLRDALPDISK